MDRVEDIPDDNLKNVPFVKMKTRFKTTADAIAVAADQYYVAPAYMWAD